MGPKARNLRLRVIPSKIANKFIREHHYSGTVVNNSTLHFGVFMDGNLHGVMSYGNSLDKSKIIGLVKDTGWSEFLELNRLAFDDYLPKNSESRAIAMSIRLLKKHAPHVKWIISFADATACGDGTIYRASNFVLTAVRENNSILEFPNGDRIHEMTIQSSPTSPRPELGGRSLYDVSGGKYSLKEYKRITNAKVVTGFQLRYIYFIDKDKRKDLTVPELPYSFIDEMGAGMYRGENISIEDRRE